MNRPHEGACTCPACCPGKWNANQLASQRISMQQTVALPSMSVWPQTIEFQMEVLRVRIDMLEAIIRAHMPLEAGYGEKLQR